ncbi:MULTISPECIES: MauE/DoxX family redox-associated membrane protein [unclassified Streptomyces]|uniref:MauE/DoxX family redox-associated membrane protein n=1 Tax=unclassified Streptomyces TaxID=2593676 RepID=UPI002B1DC8F0|nr:MULTISPECIES: MauE/DoxX family redox-associated membrane protein [unclassified Streptomyces]MCX4799423.1 hypothetical protein [Streptomyces sp. NBC_01242]WSP53099.1 hypothetical protein OG306_00540 [Streptomyces sp. NBC_01241]WSU26184.1 hypothetical protein OG508_38485 [Streptomyces sp. NBC_01108]
MVVAEAATVVFVALPATALAGFAVAIGLLIAFTTGILVAVRRRRRVLCQCFGTSSAPVGVGLEKSSAQVKRRTGTR